MIHWAVPLVHILFYCHMDSIVLYFLLKRVLIIFLISIPIQIRASQTNHYKVDMVDISMSSDMEEAVTSITDVICLHSALLLEFQIAIVVSVMFWSLSIQARF